MPDDTIMDVVNNIEGLYNAKMELFDDWIEEGDAWGEVPARREALALARRFAEEIQSMAGVEGRYTLDEIREARDQMMEEFADYREEAIQEVVERPRAPVARPAMTPSDVEHAAKYEALAREVGIDFVATLIPAPPDRIRRALDTGDWHLNTIPLRKWDQAAAMISGTGLSLGEKVSLLKHVAKWHYA